MTDNGGMNKAGERQRSIAAVMGAGHTLFSWTPLLFMVVFAIFTTAVAIDIGQLPSYGEPDPKNAGFEWLYNLSLIHI